MTKTTSRLDRWAKLLTAIAALIGALTGLLVALMPAEQATVPPPPPTKIIVHDKEPPMSRPKTAEPRGWWHDEGRHFHQGKAPFIRV